MRSCFNVKIKRNHMQLTSILSYGESIYQHVYLPIYHAQQLLCFVFLLPGPSKMVATLKKRICSLQQQIVLKKKPNCRQITVIILNIGTDRSEQTVQTQIRLLLMEQSDQGLLCLLFCLHLLNTILHCKIQLFQL